MSRDDNQYYNKSRHYGRQPGRENQRSHHYHRDHSPVNPRHSSRFDSKPSSHAFSGDIPPFVGPPQLHFNPMIQLVPPVFDPYNQRPPRYMDPQVSSQFEGNNPFHGSLNTNLPPPASINIMNNDPSRWNAPPPISGYSASQPMPQITGQSQNNIKSVSDNALISLNLPANQITDSGIIPTAPYYELPAALMVPLVPANQREYKPLKPADLRLPLPKYPDEEFMRTIDAYYGSDGRMRDNDGWDRQFIDTFVNQKKALSES